MKYKKQCILCGVWKDHKRFVGDTHICKSCRKVAKRNSKSR